MFAKIFALFAVVAVALAAPSPSPKASPEPSPQLLYTGLEYAYPAAVAPVVSPYGAPLAYSAYSAYPAPAAYYVR